MSTLNTDVEKGQDASQGATGTIYNEDTIPLRRASPPPNAPQPPKHADHNRRNFWLAIAAVVIVLALVFSVFAIFIAQPGKQSGSQTTPATPPGTTVTTTPGTDTTPAPSPGVTQGPQNGPSEVNTTAYWDTILGTQGTNSKVESVRFGHLLGNNTLQAVVVARDILGGGPVYRDVFVFDNINASHPQLLWHESPLLHGDAKISGYNTVMTSQVDVNSSINKGKLEGAWTNDLFREFKWSDGAGTFVQTAFPGFFPDMTRWQAEVEQHQVNTGQNTWRNDPVSVSKLLAAQLMNWQGALTTKVLSGGGTNDVSATIQVQGTPIQSAHPAIIVTLSRLEGNTHNIWEAISVKDGTTLTLTNIPTGSLISSPVTLTGTGSAFEGVIGQGVVYDHLFTNIGHAQLTGSPGMGIANYSIKVPFSSSFKGGAQEGIVVAYQDMGGLSSGYSSAVVVKVMIGG